MDNLQPDTNPEPWNGNPRAGKKQDRTGPHFNTSVIVHTSEGPLGNSAHSLFHWQNHQDSRYSGYHLGVDCDGFYEYADPKKVRAYHGGKSIVVPPRTAGASNDIGMSLVAYAGKWREEDPDKVSKIMEQAARCAAYLSKKYHIPLTHISREQYEDGYHGFIGHEEVALPKGRKSDPGMKTGFKWHSFLMRAEELADDGNKAQTRVPKPALNDEDVAFLSEATQNLISAKGTTRSVVYALRFYRRIAEKAGISGAKPEDVADWLLDQLPHKNDGR